MLRRCRLLVLAVVVLAGLGLATATAEPLPLAAAQGEVDKVGSDSIVIRPRSSAGKFEKALTLRVTDTSKVTILRPRMLGGGKVVAVQTDISIKDLKAKQHIAVVYTTLKEGSVLLSAVVTDPDK
jgi:hypothetical protein